MPSGMILKDLLKSKSTGSYLWPAVRQDIAKEQEEEKLGFKWKGFVSPSAQLSFDMCPQKFIQDQQQKKVFDLKIRYRMLLGHAVHDLIQQRVATRIAHLLWERPNITDPEILVKLERKWPEVPVFDPELGVSGRIDLVLKVMDSPVIVDIKSTSIVSAINLTYDEVRKRVIETFKEPTKEKVRAFVDWLLDVDNWIESWEKESAKYPSPEYKMQVEIYAYLCNRLKLYSKPVRKVGLAYVNFCIPYGEPKGEKEIYWDFPPEQEAKIEDLLLAVNVHRLAALRGEHLECTYSKCKVHAAKA